jgi:predicted amidophosphoribosyltransferase
MTICPKCKRNVFDNETSCSNCGEPNKTLESASLQKDGCFGNGWPVNR